MPISSALGSSALLPAGLGFRNIFINGAMQVAQRGTSSAGITTSGYYTVDRWHMNLSVGGTWTQTQSTDAPAGFSNSLKVQCTTANASLATTNNVRIWQKIEGFNVQQLAKGTAEAKPLVLSFWVKAFQTGTFICTLDDLTNSRKISASYTINASGTWEKKTLYFVGDTTGALTNDSSATLMPTWWLAAGPSWQGSALSTSWTSSATLSDYANGQTNVASSTNNYFQITGVQLEQNYQPTPFEQRPYGTELALCQRYYYLHTPSVGNTQKAIGVGVWYNATQIHVIIKLAQIMRAQPTLIMPNGAGYYVAYQASAALLISSLSLETGASTTTQVELYAGGLSGGTAGYASMFRTDNVAGSVAFSAEL
jgi:hypothetical protein